MMGKLPLTARRIWNSRWPKASSLRRFQNYATVTRRWRLGRGCFQPAIFSRRDAGGRLESAVERPKRLEAGIHCDRNHGHLGLAGIGERSLGFRDPVLVEEHIEI